MAVINPNMEETIALSVIQNPKHLEALLDQVPLKYFEPVIAKVLEVCLDLYTQKNQPIHPFSLEYTLGAEFVAKEEYQAIFNAEPLLDYLSIVKELKHFLQLKIQQRLINEQIKAQSRGQIFNMEFLLQYIDLEKPQEVFQTLAQLEEYYKNEPKTEKLKTYFAPFDNSKDGFFPGGIHVGSLVLIGGKHDTGKTMLGLQLLEGIARDHKVAYFCFEFSKKAYVENTIARLEKFKEKERIQDFLYVNDSEVELNELALAIKKMAKKGVKAFLIDSQMRILVEGKFFNDETPESEKFLKLFDLARDLDVLIFCIIQNSGEKKTPAYSMKGAYLAHAMVHLRFFAKNSPLIAGKYTQDEFYMLRDLEVHKNKLGKKLGRTSLMIENYRLVPHRLRKHALHEQEEV